MAITMTPAAVERVESLLKKRQTPDSWLRISLRGGGCSGFMYDYEFIPTPHEKDKKFEFNNVKICIDGKSYLFLNGMQIDYEDTLFKSGIVFNNPNAQRACGCGESVSFDINKKVTGE
jgi:iron-sulfur cluster assembly protein